MEQVDLQVVILCNKTKRESNQSSECKWSTLFLNYLVNMAINNRIFKSIHKLQIIIKIRNYFHCSNHNILILLKKSWELCKRETMGWLQINILVFKEISNRIAEIQILTINNGPHSLDKVKYFSMILNRHIKLRRVSF